MIKTNIDISNDLTVIYGNPISGIFSVGGMLIDEMLATGLKILLIDISGMSLNCNHGHENITTWQGLNREPDLYEKYESEVKNGIYDCIVLSSLYDIRYDSSDIDMRYSILQLLDTLSKYDIKTVALNYGVNTFYTESDSKQYPLILNKVHCRFNRYDNEIYVDDILLCDKRMIDTLRISRMDYHDIMRRNNKIDNILK